MKQRRMATGFPHISAIQAQSAIFIYLGIMWAIYMAVHAIEWQISQRLVQLDRDQVMDHGM